MRRHLAHWRRRSRPARSCSGRHGPLIGRHGRRPAGSPRTVSPMCRSIKTLRPPYTETLTDGDVRAAALQYVRKISGFRSPAPHNSAAFDAAVDAVAAATDELLRSLVVRGKPARAAG
jgi:hypothetical protein